VEFLTADAHLRIPWFNSKYLWFEFTNRGIDSKFHSMSYLLHVFVVGTREHFRAGNIGKIELRIGEKLKLQLPIIIISRNKK